MSTARSPQAVVVSASAFTLVVWFAVSAPAVSAAASHARDTRAAADQTAPGTARANAQASAPNAAAFLRAARAAIAHGQRAEAESIARQRGAGDPAAAAILGRLMIERGQYDEALGLLEPAAKNDPLGEAALELGLLQRTLGRTTEAARTLMPLVNDARRAVDGDRVLRGARAAHALDQTRTAHALYRQAVGLLKNDPAANTAWGVLFYDKHTPAEAVKSFRLAVEADPRWAPAHAGLARALAEEDGAAAAAASARAIEIDPALVDAYLLAAETALDRARSADARAAIDRVLAINPRSPEAHTLLAAIAWASGATSEYEAEVARALAVNPNRGDTYRVIAAHAARNYRFDEAAALGRRAIALEPTNMPAHAELGMHLLRVGNEQEAREVLETAFGGDPYDAVTLNLLRVLKTLDGFASLAAGVATIRMDPAEAPVLGLYAAPLVARAFAEMSRRYGIEMRDPITVQIFSNHDDFAVRTAGLPGMSGALGASFGSVVTQDSPRAREPGSFNWLATMWHELAHVFTLRASNQRVPRWVTEGISVYEEGLADPAWRRDAELGFARAYSQGRALKIADLNSGFARPDMLSVAYFESSLVVGLLVDRYGFEGVRAMLRAFADGADVEAAVRRATQGSVAELQAAFDARLEERYSGVAAALRVPDGVQLPGAGTVESWTALAAKLPGSYPVQMAAGQALASAGARDAAIAAYERAASLVPFVTGADSPRARLADLAERDGDLRRALSELSSLLTDDHLSVEIARKLARLAGRLGDQKAAALAWGRVVAVDPFDAAAHSALGRLAAGANDTSLALREFHAAVAAGPADPAASRSDLAEALLTSGQPAEAKREVLAALELAPTYERAQELLLKIVDGKQ